MKNAILGALIAGACFTGTANAQQTSYPAPEAACPQTGMTIYFAANETALTSAAEAVIAAQADMLAVCDMRPVSVTAASTDGNSHNEARRLSDARADAVLQALTDAGLAPAVSGLIPEYKDETAGTDTTPTLLARRVDITLATRDAVIAG